MIFIDYLLAVGIVFTVVAVWRDAQSRGEAE